jgi:hypothetical protein
VELPLTLPLCSFVARRPRRRGAAQFWQPMPIMIWIAVVIELALAIKYGESWADFGVLLALQIINGTVSLCVLCSFFVALLCLARS